MPMTTTDDDDGVCRRLALQIAAQLAEDRDLALRSLEYAKQPVEFTDGAGIQVRTTTVTSLKPVG
jgi:hypothetical protein